MKSVWSFLYVMLLSIQFMNSAAAAPQSAQALMEFSAAEPDSAVTLRWEALVVPAVSDGFIPASISDADLLDRFGIDEMTSVEQLAVEEKIFHTAIEALWLRHLSVEDLLYPAEDPETFGFFGFSEPYHRPLSVS